MQPVLSCFTRNFFKEDESEHQAPGEQWLTQQLKGTREQLCKKSEFCDQLADRLRELEADVKRRSCAEYEVRDILNITKSELRVASRARDQQEAAEAELRSLTDSLQIEAKALRLREADSEALAARLQSQATSARDAESAKQAEVIQLRQRLADHEASTPREGKRLASSCDGTPSDTDAHLGGKAAMPTSPRDKAKVPRHEVVANRAHATASALETELLQQLEHERELHEEALRMLKHQKVERVEQASELQQELASLSRNLEEKEEDILSIQFDMVELQNRLVDQAHLVSENADAFQTASEELADKDERLGDAMVAQEELASQMREVSGKLQEKVEYLSQELDRSRSAYKALDEQTRAVVSGLEKERDGLISEKASLHSELESVKVLLERHLNEAAEQKQACSAETSRTLELQDQLATANERLDLAEAQLRDQAAALERAQFMERQAVERAQEYRASLELYREFGKEDFMKEEQGFPSPKIELQDLVVPDEGSTDAVGDSCLMSVLVSVEMDLGFTTAVQSIAPWQTKAEFDIVVQDFLQEHKVRAIFASAIVRYLEEVETNAVTFPTHVSANLVDIYSRYS